MQVAAFVGFRSASFCFVSFRFVSLKSVQREPAFRKHLKLVCHFHIGECSPMMPSKKKINGAANIKGNDTVFYRSATVPTTSTYVIAFRRTVIYVQLMFSLIFIHALCARCIAVRYVIQESTKSFAFFIQVHIWRALFPLATLCANKNRRINPEVCKRRVSTFVSSERNITVLKIQGTAFSIFAMSFSEEESNGRKRMIKVILPSYVVILPITAFDVQYKVEENAPRLLREK